MMRMVYFLSTLSLLYAMACNQLNEQHGTEQSKTFIDQSQRIPHLDEVKMRDKAKEAYVFCHTNKYNLGFCVLVDMGVHSGVKRCAVWDFTGDSIRYRFVVSHGCGTHPWGEDGSKESPTFSNEHESHCTSLGKYKIGERGYSNWGVHTKYTLHGLDSTNNNAKNRFIVLHSWESIPDEEVFPKGCPEGWGCPALSDNSFNILDTLLKKSKIPVLLWIYS
jgi:hypothetical protein